MAVESVRRLPRAILIDAGGVLIPDYWPAAAADWAARLGTFPSSFMAALFGGSDDEVLVGRVGEDAWWQVVAGRLQIGADLLAELRADLAARSSWDAALLACLADIHGSASIVIVSNAWPHMRERIAEGGLLDIADHVVLSCEVGQAKPAPAIYRAALQEAGAQARNVLFVDDVPGHVVVAEALGMTGHLHVNTPDTTARIRHFVGSPAPGPG
jgi:putative hydrolase of the HAD superfamily